MMMPLPARDLAPLPLPEPSLGRHAYLRERRRALLRSPRKLANYIRYLRARRGAQLDYLPIKLDIENVSRCNFRCVMCQVSDWPGMKRAADMSFDDFRRLIDAQHGLVEIKLQGMGEPTLARDALYRMIAYARTKRIWVRTITNASLLHLNDNYRKMIDSGANEVQISIDGATRATFESIRRGSKFERVVENCRLINAYANVRGALPTKMWTVVQQQNVHELHELVHLGGDLGFRHLVFSLEMMGWGQERWDTISRGLSVGGRVTPQLAQDLVQAGRRRGVRVAFWRTVSKYRTGSPTTLCPWPFERAYVSSDMRVVPCCMVANPDTSDLGDARSFAAQWHSRAYQAFRQAHLDGDVPAICRGCYQ